MVNWSNIGNTLARLGSGLTQTAMTSYTLRASTNPCNYSIFGFGGCGMGYSMGMGGMMSPYNSIANPMGIGVFNQYNAYNAMNTQYGNALAAQWGMTLMQQAKMNNISLPQMYQTTNKTQKTDNEYAGDIDKNQDTTQGAAFNKATSEMVDEDGEVVKDKSFTISQAKDGEEYTKDLSNLSKSYLADIDKSVGNGDGEISVDEYINYKMKSQNLANANAEQKSDAMKLGQISFSKLDQNGDNKLDWKEMAAGFATFDSDSTGKSKKDLDGKITSEDFATWSEYLVNQNSNVFDTTVRKNYTQLFGKKDDEDS